MGQRRRPLIGITTYPPNKNGRFELPEPYVASLRRAGADVVLLPPGTDGVEVAIASILDRLDGLLLAGGGDVDPALYGGGSHETVYALNPDRDRAEIAAVHRLLEAGLPTLAICRGSQVLNVALGGSLVAHLPDRLGADGTPHRVEPEELRGMPAPTTHEVAVVAGSLIAETMAATTVTPMSWHHQAVDRLGTGLRVVATAPDGTIEAIEHESHPWLAAVQWHPELTSHEDPTQQRLFDAFVEASAGRQ